MADYMNGCHTKLTLGVLSAVNLIYSVLQVQFMNASVQIR